VTVTNGLLPKSGPLSHELLGIFASAQCVFDSVAPTKFNRKVLRSHSVSKGTAGYHMKWPTENSTDHLALLDTDPSGQFCGSSQITKESSGGSMDGVLTSLCGAY
jgi:hypothetical protein